MLNLATLNSNRNFSGAVFFTNNDYYYNCKSTRNKVKLLNRLNNSNLNFKSIASNKKHSNNIAIYYRSETTYIKIFGNKNLLFNANLSDILDVVSSRYFKYIEISDIIDYKEVSK